VVKDLVVKNRSYRRFFEDHKIDRETLRGFIDLARLSASAANMQPLKYILSCESKKNDAIFPRLGWAAYLKDWPGPDKGERPAAYIIILLDTGISKSPWCDHGIAAQSILLGAVEKGLGGCMIASIQRNQLREALDIPKKYEILLVIALGKPKEEVRIENVDEEGEIEYWRDEHDIHHVPKRSLDEIILE